MTRKLRVRPEEPAVPGWVTGLVVVLAVAALLAVASSVRGDPVRRGQPDLVPSKVWTEQVTLSTSAWTCRRLVDKVNRPRTEDWRTFGFLVDNHGADGETACMLTDHILEDTVGKTCANADFYVPGALARPWTDPELALKSWCARSVSGSPVVSFVGPY